MYRINMINKKNKSKKYRGLDEYSHCKKINKNLSQINLIFLSKL